MNISIDELFGSERSKLVSLSVEEQHRLMHEWNATETDYPRTLCLHELVKAQVEITPDAVAIEFAGKVLTYRELNARADRLASHLRSLGVGPDTRVAICMGRTFGMVIGVLAILKAGGAYVPLDPRYPAERLAFMLEDAKATVLLTQTDLAKELPSTETHTIFLDTWDWSQPESGDGASGLDKPTPNSLAYIIYTSGSTGKPKGVAMIHRALVNLIEWKKKESDGLPSEARTLQYSSLSFDASFHEIFATWCSGGTLVLMTEELRYDPMSLWQYICTKQIHRLFLPFVALAQLAETACESDDNPSVLREVLSTAEQLQITPKIQAMFRNLPNAVLRNHYGPSETHVVTSYTLPPGVDSWTPLPPIGKPIANTRIYLLDEQCHPVPLGEPGELYAGGDCLARGYFDRAELTQRFFVPDPFAGEPGARMYRTGDLARYLSDGNIEFLGRMDDQIKIRGHRVELGEIEAVLAQHPEVRECAVAAHGKGGEKQIVAYVVPFSGRRLSNADLRGFLKKKLSDYMVPSHFVSIDQLPLTPSGKVDRRALLKLDLPQEQASTKFVSPRNAMEQSIAKIWQEVLGLPKVGVLDNFFDLGGNSLKAVALFSELERCTGKRLPVAALFRAPTVAELAKYKETQAELKSLVPIQPHGTRLPLFLVHAHGGEVIFYRDLANCLDADQPIYALKARPASGGATRYPSVEEMASIYLEEIRSVQPKGPYYLGGYCLGGIIVYELARQIARSGEDVALAALFEATPQNHSLFSAMMPRWRRRFFEVLYDIEMHWGSLEMLNGSKRVAYLKARIPRAYQLFRRKLLWKLKHRGRQVQPTEKLTLDETIELTQLSIQQSVDQYVPLPYDGRIVLFCPNRLPHGASPDHTWGWNTVPVKELEIVEIPVRVGAIALYPRVPLLAERLKAYLPSTAAQQP